MKTQYCPACYPNKIKSHRGIWWGDFLDIFLNVLFGSGIKPQLPRFPRWFSVTHYWYCLMELCRIVRFSEDFDKKEHYPRSWAVIEEAKKRGIKIEQIKILGRVAIYYRVTFGSKCYYYDAVPSRFLNFRLDEKAYSKRKLLQAGFPASEGKMFWSAKRASRYGLKLGFPLAVKPSRGTHAYHVTAPVNNEEELQKAIALSKQYQPRFIVEKYLTGRLYRITVINFNQVFTARREAPNVIGDGQHTIRELIEIKNTDPRRGEIGQKDTTLHKISLPPPLRGGMPPLSGGVDIPAKGQKIILHNKISISSGGDVLEETPLLHPENREMFRRAARIFGTDLIGFDVIADDLNRPYTEQNCGIIEANSIPMIDFHHYPSSGQPQNTAATLWDAILSDKRVRYLHPVMMAERSLYTRAIWHFFDIVIPIIRAFLQKFIVFRRFVRRQKYPLGKLSSGISPEQAIAHLKTHGFEVVRPEWIDFGEIAGLRKLLNAERQCHIRFFDDGEVRAHLEYAPEARPLAHILERGMKPANGIARQYLHNYVEICKT